MYDESWLPRIGSNIRLLRGACQFNQQQFAERIGISQTHLSNIEHNNVQVSLKLLVRSANVLDCTLETLLDRKAAAEWAQAHESSGCTFCSLDKNSQYQLRSNNCEDINKFFKGGVAAEQKAAKTELGKKGGAKWQNKYISVLGSTKTSADSPGSLLPHWCITTFNMI